MRPDLSDDLFQSLMWGHVRLMSRVAIYLYLFLRCLSHCILGRTLSFGTIMILYSLVIPKTIFRNFMQLSWFISAGNNEHGSCEAMILSINFSFFFPGCLLFTYRIELFVFFFNLMQHQKYNRVFLSTFVLLSLLRMKMSQLVWASLIRTPSLIKTPSLYQAPPLSINHTLSLLSTPSLL